MSAWTSVRDSLVKLGLPALGNLVLPGSGTAITLLTGALGLKADAAPADIASAIATNPDNVVKLREIEAGMQKAVLDAQTAERAADSADVAAVNATMQAEAKSEHWLQWSWRPLNGYALALGSFALVIGVLVLAYQAVQAKDFATLNAIPTVVMAVTAALSIPGAVCGVTAWHRGVAQRIEAQNGHS